MGGRLHRAANQRPVGLVQKEQQDGAQSVVARSPRVRSVFPASCRACSIVGRPIASRDLGSKQGVLAGSWDLLADGPENRAKEVRGHGEVPRELKQH